MAVHLVGLGQELIESQHGIIARWQLAQAGQGVRIIDAQLHSGRWQPVYRGVYATFTGRPSRIALLWAAVLRGGPGAVLSHDTADIHRDNASAEAGIVRLRYNWADVSQEPCRVAAEIAKVLRHHGWTGRPRACGPGCAASSA